MRRGKPVARRSPSSVRWGGSRIVHRRKTHWGAHQAPAAEEVDGPGGAGPPYGTVGQLSVAAGDGTRGADAAQPGAHCDGVLERPELLLRSRAADVVPGASPRRAGAA